MILPRMTEVLAEQHRRTLLSEARVRRRWVRRRPRDDSAGRRPRLRVVPPRPEASGVEDPAA